MALNPLQNEEERFEEFDEELDPTLTYKLDLDNGRIGGLFDGEDAIRQFIRKALRTARFRFLIFDDQYGSEIDDLVGSDVPDAFIESELPHVIREALIYDDRIAEVKDFVLTRDKGDLHVNFTVVTVEGWNITEELEVLRNGI